MECWVFCVLLLWGAGKRKALQWTQLTDTDHSNMTGVLDEHFKEEVYLNFRIELKEHMIDWRNSCYFAKVALRYTAWKRNFDSRYDIHEIPWKSFWRGWLPL